MNHIKRWILCLLAMTIAGCDTVAEISFDNEQVMSLKPLGLVSASCGQSPHVDAVLRFNVLTSLDRRLEPGMRLVGMDEPLMVSSSMSASKLLFSEAWAFEADAQGHDRTCETADECGQGASCLSPSQMGLADAYYAPQNYCVVPLKISLSGAPVYSHFGESSAEYFGAISQHANGRAIGFVMDNSATLDGSHLDGSENDEVATDPYQYRRLGLTAFMDTLSSGVGGSYALSTWFANGVGEAGVYDATPTWLRTTGQFKSEVVSKFPTPSGGSPIWETSLAAITRLVDEANTSYTRTLVVFTDGEPNQNSGEAFSEFSKKLVAAPTMALSWIDLTPNDVASTKAYADAVSKQCGAYFNFESASQIPDVMRRIALATESWWDVGVSFDAKLVPGTMYRIATRLVFSVGNGAASFNAQRRVDNSVVIDDRFVIVAQEAKL